MLFFKRYSLILAVSSPDFCKNKNIFCGFLQGFPTFTSSPAPIHKNACRMPDYAAF
jgi:hypothetical protein